MKLQRFISRVLVRLILRLIPSLVSYIQLNKIYTSLNFLVSIAYTTNNTNKSYLLNNICFTVTGSKGGDSNEDVSP